jgi:hypothetical protein
MHWPQGKRFAFTVVDDTDFSTVTNTKPVYEFLEDEGFHTTKTVWVFPAEGKASTGGHSLERSEYCDWIQSLQERGFEIGLHGVSDGSSMRERTAAGLERFRELLRGDPSIHVNHVRQREAMYWGASRLDPPLRWLYERYRRSRGDCDYCGDESASPYFWGDLCRKRVRYVRNFVFREINTLKADPLMPYHDPRRPFVARWFSASYGAGVTDFCNLISEANQDRLAEEGGACIVYTHFADGFTPLPERFKRLLRRLASLDGWFVPATTLLDHVGAVRLWPSLSADGSAGRRLQLRWMCDQFARRIFPPRREPPAGLWPAAPRPTGRPSRETP